MKRREVLPQAPSMAIILRLKPKWRRLNPKPTATHFFSSDSKQPTSDFPSFREIKDAARKNPSSSSQNPTEKTPSPFADIKSHLRSKFPPPRRSFNTPPSLLNDVLPPQRSSAPSSMEEIRRHLQEFKPTVLSNSRKTESQETRAEPSFKAISESLRTIRENDRRNIVNHTVGKSFGSAGLSLYNLGAKPDPLPLLIFGREIKEKEKATEEEEMELVKVYNYRELGEKMIALRSSSKEKKGELFSLGNLGERLKKLRGIEEKQRETEPKIGGFSAKDLQDSLYKKTLPRRPSMPLPGAGLLGQLGMQSTPSYMLAPPQEHLVEKYFHPDNMSSQEKLKLELQRVREEFKMSESDCGSTRVQVALLTTKIKHLSTALHKKDKHSRRGLQAMVQKRKKLLKYLRRTDWDSYTLVLSKLGLRDNPEVKA